MVQVPYVEKYPDTGSPAGIGMAAAIKPPLGVMPERLWREQRAKELSRAIREYMEAGIYPPVIDWIEELNQIWPQVSASRP